MKHLIKKDNRTIVIISIITVCLLGACLAWGIFSALNNVDEDSFWFVKLEGIIAIALDILVGVLIAFLILFVGEKNENNRKRMDLIHEILNQIEDYFTNELFLSKDSDLSVFWSVSLSVKKMSRQLIDNLNKLSFSSTLSNSIVVLNDKCKNYFEYIENYCFPNAVLVGSIINNEKNLREEIIISIKTCICDAFI